MTDILALDRHSVRSYDRDGRLLIAVANISKATVNDYIGGEIPGAKALGLDPKKLYRVLRPPEELEKAASTFNNLPVLSKHVGVTAEQPRKELIVGTSGSHARFIKPYLQNSLAFWDQKAIDKIEAEEMRELSCAYHYVAMPYNGVYEGMAYDLRMADIVGNHIALVGKGRAGSDVMVGDSALELAFDAMPLLTTREKNPHDLLKLHGVRDLLQLRR